MISTVREQQRYNLPAVRVCWAAFKTPLTEMNGSAVVTLTGRLLPRLRSPDLAGTDAPKSRPRSVPFAPLTKVEIVYITPLRAAS